eukprot:401712-Prymnesium_polylepis.1
MSWVAVGCHCEVRQDGGWYAASVVETTPAGDTLIEIEGGDSEPSTRPISELRPRPSKPEDGFADGLTAGTSIEVRVGKHAFFGATFLSSADGECQVRMTNGGEEC